MFARLVGQSLARNPRRKLLAAAALAVGMAVTTATLSVALDVGDRLAREFRSLGANVLVTPQSDTLPLQIGGVDYRPVDEGAYLNEGDLGKLKTIFWRNNIVGFTAFLNVPAEFAYPGKPRVSQPALLIGTWYEHSVSVPDGSAFRTGLSVTHPWWKMEGRWFRDEAKECVFGTELARRLGASKAIFTPGMVVYVSQRHAEGFEGEKKLVPVRVTGIVSTGGPEDGAIIAPLALAQELSGHPGQFRQLFVSALTKPEDAFSRRDPATLTPAEYDRWYCSPYISSISRQIQEVLPGTEARAVRRVAETEGRVLSRVSALLWLATLAALIAAALAVAATAAATVLERRAEIALMKALGAANRVVMALFLAEQILLAVVGGGAGFALGSVLAHFLGLSIFKVSATPRALLLPVVLALAAIVATAGSLVPLRRAAGFDPAPILRGE